nr:MAG TPA: hypothetical protein [Microviridae sp.]
MIISTLCRRSRRAARINLLFFKRKLHIPLLEDI